MRLGEILIQKHLITGEDLDGLPAQIAMQGSKKQLMEAQRLGGAALESAIHAVQY